MKKYEGMGAYCIENYSPECQKAIDEARKIMQHDKWAGFTYIPHTLAAIFEGILLGRGISLEEAKHAGYLALSKNCWRPDVKLVPAELINKLESFWVLTSSEKLSLCDAIDYLVQERNRLIENGQVEEKNLDWLKIDNKLLTDLAYKFRGY